MAQILPSGWREFATTGAAAREIATLERFADGLDDDYVVFHGVHWTNVEADYSVYGEIDFIVVAPNGRVLVIEQKSGFLQETEGGLIKRYPGRSENVHLDLVRTIGTLRHRFAQSGATLDIDYLLFCPDYRVTQPALAGLDPQRIVDAHNADQLVPVLRRLLPLSPVGVQRAAVLRFFNDTLRLIPDASAMVGRADALVTRLSHGLATWARQIEFTPFRLRVIGTAGSGKTQLAVREFHAALAAGFTFDNFKKAKALMKEAGLRNTKRGFGGEWWSGIGEPSAWTFRLDKDGTTPATEMSVPEWARGGGPKLFTEGRTLYAPETDGATL